VRGELLATKATRQMPTLRILLSLWSSPLLRDIAMRKILLSIIITGAVLGTCAAVGQQRDVGSFERVKAKTFGKEYFRPLFTLFRG